ncbi:MAG: PilC/PilY family type IV pilus protein [Polyangiales bacterium]
MQLRRPNVLQPRRTLWRSSKLGAAMLLAAGVAVMSADAAAQTPDVRLIRPNLLLLVDTSGSMEWRTNTLNSDCIGRDGGICNRTSSGGSICAVTAPTDERRNRWTTAIEVLTGTIENFSCQEVPRTDPSQYDYLYPISHHIPLSNGVPLNQAGAVQIGDGILDVYADRVRFGLMTFDNDQNTGLAAYNGMYSFGDDQTYRPNGCPDSTAVNLGVKRASSDNNVADIVPGGMVSMGAHDLDTAGLALRNRMVQESLVGRPADGSTPALPAVRPFGGTPIAAMLHDAEYFWTTHTDVRSTAMGGAGDPYFRCRTRANVLITDGQPNMDYHPFCVGGRCPYPDADQTAMTMAMSGGTAPNARTYVIAFNANDTQATAALQPIAVAGNTARVYYANDRPSFSAALSTVIDTVTALNSTRTPPVFAQPGSNATPSGSVLYQFNASFNVAPGQPWAGSLTRTRSLCQSMSMSDPPVPTEVLPDQSNRDDFAFNLRAASRASAGWGPRYLWTWTPTAATNASGMQTRLSSSVTGAGTATELTAAMRPELFNAGSMSEVSQLLGWLRGDTGTVRQNRPLGDIYHSVPQSVPAPNVDLPDQTFLAFRQRQLPVTGRRATAATVGTREPMVYVGTNDGILHAFNADTGEEAWGFVPPYLVPQIRTGYPSTRMMGVDGTPVVKEIMFERSPSALNDDTGWHSVLVVGLRNGGGAYVGLDVTDPYNPSFLWQFTDSDLHSASGAPSIGTLYFTPPGRTAPVERAVAFLPGGSAPLSTTPCDSSTNLRPARSTHALSGWSGRRGARRASTRCWQGSTGQWLYVVDLQTGELIRKIGAGAGGGSPTGSPLVGAPALYNGAAGAVSTRAYVGDADGTLWRADFSSRDPSQWWMVDVYDLFWDKAYDAGQPIVEKPVITVDSQGRTLVAFGSGDPDLLEGTHENRIASILEAASVDGNGLASAIDVQAVWELRPDMDTSRGFFAGERLTGQLTLFNNVLYFGTFVPQGGSDPCDIGFARLWGVDMAKSDGANSVTPLARLDLDGNPATTSDIVRATRDLNNNSDNTDDANTILFGVTAARRATCNVTTSSTDPLTGQPRSYVSSSNGGEYRLYLNIVQTGMNMGTRTQSVSRPLSTPIFPARIDSWATVFE